MIRKTISMPDEMGAWIEARVKSGQYGNDSEYLRDLVRRDQERQDALLALQSAIDEGFEGDDLDCTVEDVFQDALKLEGVLAKA